VTTKHPCLSWLGGQHGGCLIRDRECLPFASSWVHPRLCSGVPVPHLFDFQCLCALFCHRHVFCVPNVVASVSGLSSLDYFFAFRILHRRGVLDRTLCDKICQWFAAGWWFSPGTPVSSTNKTDCHDIAEILIKVALITITLTPITSVFSNVYLYIRNKTLLSVDIKTANNIRVHHNHLACTFGGERILITNMK
jgi:hypothetical protein